ncbi:MAG: alpha/beta fold hydrolase [bacterium]
MTKKIKRWLLQMLVVVIVGFALLNILACNIAYAMTHYAAGGARTPKPEDISYLGKLKVLFTGVNLPRPVSDISPLELGAGCRVLSVAVGSNVTLCAWYRGLGKDKPLAILFHGYGAEKTSMVREAKEFMALGASVMLIDFRGSGGSSESYTTIGVCEADDVVAAFRYANDNLPHSSIVLFGKSMGAASILRAVHVNHITPDAVILEAVFDTMFNTVCNRFRLLGIPSFPSARLLVFWGGRQWGFDGFAHNPVDYARSLKCPSLFMHGDNDVKATIADGRRVFAAVQGPKEFREFAALGHEDYIAKYPDEWRAAVAKIMRRRWVTE